MNHEKESEVLASFVHGALSAGHLLGFLYNVRRANWKTAGFHLGAFTFDCWAAFDHWRDSQKRRVE